MGHRSAHERFEIDGANAARAFLERHSLPEEQVMTVWESIALHTTRQVPDYKQPEVRLVALGMQYDLYGSPFDALSPEQRDAVLAVHPRTKFKTGMIDALAAGSPMFVSSSRLVHLPGWGPVRDPRRGCSPQAS